MTQAPRMHPTAEWPHPRNKKAAEKWFEDIFSKMKAAESLRRQVDKDVKKKQGEGSEPYHFTEVDERYSLEKNPATGNLILRDHTTGEILRDDLPAHGTLVSLPLFGRMLRYLKSWEAYEPLEKTGESLAKLRFGDEKLPILHAIYRSFHPKDFAQLGMKLVHEMGVPADQTRPDGTTVLAEMFQVRDLGTLETWLNVGKDFTMHRDPATLRVTENFASTWASLCGVSGSDSRLKHMFTDLPKIFPREVVVQPLYDVSTQGERTAFTLAAQYNLHEAIGEWIGRMGPSILNETRYSYPQHPDQSFAPYLLPTSFALAETVDIMLNHPTYPSAPTMDDCRYAKFVLGMYGKSPEMLIETLHPGARNSIREAGDLERTLEIWEEACEPFHLSWPSHDEL